MLTFASRCFLLNDQNEVLFLKHDPAWRFALPWWHIEDWESPYHALTREAKEELWYEIEILWIKTWVQHPDDATLKKYWTVSKVELPLPLYIQQLRYKTIKYWEVDKFEYFFVAKVVSWDFKIQTEEISDHRRIKLDEVKPWLALDVYEYLIEIVEKNRDLIKDLIK